MTKRIDDVEGIGLKYAALLMSEGVKTTDNLLEVGADRKGRKSLAEKTAISEKMLLTWVNMCDLFRVRGVGGQFAELLEAAGVDTVKELRTRNAANLALAMAEVNKARRICRVSPSIVMTSKWIEEAKQLRPVVSH